MNFKSVDEVLDFAIKAEEEAYLFYTDLAARVDKQWIQTMLQGFAREELGHKAKLQAVKSGKRIMLPGNKVQDLKLAEYTVEQKPDPDLDYQQALVLAMQKEKKAFKLYTDLAEAAESRELTDIFHALAQEEAKHKLYFEIEYDEYVLKDN
jgi:rubrerythrin